MTYHLHRELWVRRPLLEVFDFFATAENLEQITPPWTKFKILSQPPIQMSPGATIEYTIRVRGLPLRWLTTIETWRPPFEFVDVQTKGPYKLWRHTHRFFEQNGGTLITDDVDYALPFGPIGSFVNWLIVAKDISRIFDYRTQRVQEIFPQLPTPFKPSR